MDAPDARDVPADRAPPVPLAEIARHWGRIGCIGFGGPPAHIALLRRLCVSDKGWISANEFEDAIAVANLLPGPASTQLAIFCAWRLRGWAGALVGAVCFIGPGLVVIIALSALFLASHPPLWVTGAAAGAGSAVAAVALNAAASLVPASWQRASRGPSITGRPRPLRGSQPATGRRHRSAQARWVAYAGAGAVAACLVGPYLVLVLLGAGCAEVLWQAGPAGGSGPRSSAGVIILSMLPPLGGLGALAWVAFKVGALSYGGGFVIVPLMQADAVQHYHWMTGAQFLNAVALGQVTPGPVVQTVAVVGYAADKLRGALLAAVIAFTPSFCFVVFGGHRFDQIRANERVRAFLGGAGPAAIGAIAGSAVPLALALGHVWQAVVLVAALIWLVVLRRNVVIGLLAAGVAGVVAALAGLPVAV
jgi:chromate transporter